MLIDEWQKKIQQLQKEGVIVAGVDEVGRGPLAGDVVAAAVILGADHGIEGLADSKKISEKQREKLYPQIIERAVGYCVGRASVHEIDEINILQASLLAMKRSVEGLACKPGLVYVDGNRLPPWEYKSQSVIKGDSYIAEISAASILAKVVRDREMTSLDEVYPGYGFKEHKGYPTKKHLQALEDLGVTDIHRRSFGPVNKLIS